MNFPPHALLAMLAAALIASAPVTAAADSERGRGLYETRCGNCHSHSVHGREKREARDFEAVRGWVRRWSGNLGLAWTDDDINDVSEHLNALYYRYPCPTHICRATGRGPGSSPLALAR
jgi:mono/diheme cytochrome c family protein